MITEQWIREQIQQGTEYKFYKTQEWQELRARILEKHHNECQDCLKVGKYTEAKNVHHVNELKDRPDLALNEYYIDSSTGERKKNLVPLCVYCHNVRHKRVCRSEHRPQLNEERW